MARWPLLGGMGRDSVVFWMSWCFVLTGGRSAAVRRAALTSAAACLGQPPVGAAEFVGWWEPPRVKGGCQILRRVSGKSPSTSRQIKAPAASTSTPSATAIEVMTHAPSPVRALSVDQDRVAVLRADGRTSVFAFDGSSVATLKTRSPRAIALRGDTLATVSRNGRLETWNLNSGGREHSWRLPRGTRPSIDVHFGIAVFSASRTVYAMRLDTGRVAALARAPHSARVQIEASGVVYEFTARGESVLRFIPFAAVERTLSLVRTS